MASTRDINDARSEAFREWIEAICRKKGITRTELGRLAKVSHSTLSRATNRNGGHVNFRADTIAKLADASGMAPPTLLANLPPVPANEGFSEDEALPLLDDASASLPAGQSQWLCRTGTLAPMGLLAGDTFILDQNATPRARDMIVVQQYDQQQGTAETLLRVYADGFAVDPPYLINGAPRLWLDGGNAQCMGVIIKSWRTRAAT